LSIASAYHWMQRAAAGTSTVQRELDGFAHVQCFEQGEFVLGRQDLLGKAPAAPSCVRPEAAGPSGRRQRRPGAGHGGIDVCRLAARDAAEPAGVDRRVLGESAAIGGIASLAFDDTAAIQGQRCSPFSPAQGRGRHAQKLTSTEVASRWLDLLVSCRP
jgi:hypothetical protein